MHRFLQQLLSWSLIILLYTPSMAFVCTTNCWSSPHLTRQSSIIRLPTTAVSSNDQDATAPLDHNRAKAWQHVKKPLLRIGGKGATKSHGNSLRQLLDQHTVVKVKVNTGPDNSLESASDVLKQLAIDSGADADIELIHIRNSDNTIMFGSAGSLEMIDNGAFPPPPPISREEYLKNQEADRKQIE